MEKVKYLLSLTALLMLHVVFAQQTGIRKLNSFSKLDVSGSLNAFLQKGSEESVKIVARGIELDKIITEVKDNDLRVYIENGNYRDISVDVYITYKDLTSIEKSGSGNLECNSPLGGGDFDFGMSGSGNTSFKEKINANAFIISKSGSGTVKVSSVESREMKISVSGSGDVGISNGSAKKQTLHLSGSATIRLEGVKGEECNASISGSGNIEVSVSAKLEGRIAGSGNIIYTGDPEVNKHSMIGSGRITKKS